MTIAQVLNYLVSGGAVVLAAAFCSWAADNIPQFRALTTMAKQASMIGLCLALSLGAWAIQTYVPAAVLAQLAAPFGVAVLTIGALLGNQAWHQLVNRANPGPPAPAAPISTVATS